MLLRDAPTWRMPLSFSQKHCARLPAYPDLAPIDTQPSTPVLLTKFASCLVHYLLTANSGRPSATKPVYCRKMPPMQAKSSGTKTQRN